MNRQFSELLTSTSSHCGNLRSQLSTGRSSTLGLTCHVERCLISGLVSAKIDCLTRFNLVWQLRDVDLESTLNSLQDLLVLGRRDEGDSESFGTETTSSSYTVQIGISFARNVVVDRDVDALNINTSTENIRADSDTLLERFELLVSSDSVNVSTRLSLSRLHHTDLLAEDLHVSR